MIQRLPVLIIMLATPAAAFITSTTVRGTAFQATPLMARGVSWQGATRALPVPGMRKAALAPLLVRSYGWHETRMKTSWGQASKAEVCFLKPPYMPGCLKVSSSANKQHTHCTGMHLS
jgi:hypothetical protein